MSYNLPDGCTEAKVEAFWGTDAQEAASREYNAATESVEFLREDMNALLEKYARLLDISSERLKEAKDGAHDLISDFVGSKLAELEDAQ